jgi:hypothetical protein
MGTTTPTKPQLDYVSICVQRWKEDPFLSVADLFRELNERPDFTKSYETLHRNVKSLRPNPATPPAVKAALAAVADTTEARELADAKAAAALVDQIKAVTIALDAGIGATELSGITGLSVSRLYDMKKYQA